MEDLHQVSGAVLQQIQQLLASAILLNSLQQILNQLDLAVSISRIISAVQDLVSLTTLRSRKLKQVLEDELIIAIGDLETLVTLSSSITNIGKRVGSLSSDRLVSPRRVARFRGRG